MTNGRFTLRFESRLIDSHGEITPPPWGAYAAAHANPGDLVRYRIEVSNRWDQPLGDSKRGVTIEAYLEANATYVKGTKTAIDAKNVQYRLPETWGGELRPTVNGRSYTASGPSGYSFDQFYSVFVPSRSLAFDVGVVLPGTTACVYFTAAVTEDCQSQRVSSMAICHVPMPMVLEPVPHYCGNTVYVVHDESWKDEVRYGHATVPEVGRDKSHDDASYGQASAGPVSLHLDETMFD